MEKNNGKIAIAIVAMFVVALSIVGVTYAYFTATIQGNQSEDYSVEVDAGRLAVRYEGTSTITANNIVPGWISDGKMYYDPVHSLQDVQEIGEDGQPTNNTIKGIVAVDSTNLGTNAEGVEKTPTVTPSDYGLTDPIKFNVTNDGTDTAYYAIRLIDVTNEIVDQSNFTYTIYESDDETFAEGEIVAGPAELKDGDQTILATTSVDVDATKYYQVVLAYADKGNQNASSSTSGNPVSVSATVEVVGLNQTGTALVD